MLKAIDQRVGELIFNMRAGISFITHGRVKNEQVRKKGSTSPGRYETARSIITVGHFSSNDQEINHPTSDRNLWPRYRYDLAAETG
jgi:hypothetical protein